MKPTKTLIAGSLAALIGFGAAGSAFAEKASAGSENEMAETAALLSAKLSVADAAKTAEAEAGGKAVDVSLEDEDGAILYEVETLKADGTETRVMIDASDGKIVKVAQITDDEEDEDDDGKD